MFQKSFASLQTFHSKKIPSQKIIIQFLSRSTYPNTSPCLKKKTTLINTNLTEKLHLKFPDRAKGVQSASIDNPIHHPSGPLRLVLYTLSHSCPIHIYAGRLHVTGTIPLLSSLFLSHRYTRARAG